MNFLSLNIKGVRRDHKHAWVRKLKSDYCVNFIALQETMAEDIKDIPVEKLWGFQASDFAAVASVGRSGGLISIWDPNVFVKEEVELNRNFVGIKGKLIGVVEPLIIVNVYGPKTPVQKRIVWNEIWGLKQRWNGLWLIMGDFNAVRYDRKRRNSDFCRLTARDFNRFIDKMELVDPNMGGHQFTYMNTRGDKLSKIDRFLFCRGFFDRWPRSAVTALSRLHSDHCPILLDVGKVDFRPKVFKCFNSWFFREDFERTVRLAYALSPRGGEVDRCLLIKLQEIKKAIKGWWLETKNKEEGEGRILKEKIGKIEMAAEGRDLTDSERADREGWVKRINELESFKARDLRQKAKIKWAVDGDENSRFFHGVVNVRSLSNRINGLIIGGQWVTKPWRIKEEMLLHFKDRFTEPLAYDSVNWDFLGDIMGFMGFPGLWCCWVRGCLESGTTSVLVNGSPTKEFTASRGLRQGDPMSPLLFAVVMEALHVVTLRARDVGAFRGLQFPNQGPVLSHIFFADDVVFVGEASEGNLMNLARLLRCFNLASGLKVSFQKSSLFGVGIEGGGLGRLAGLIHCKVGDLPSTYLGVWDWVNSSSEHGLST
ncbi:hypothetical protein SSX86_016392 [Deinandra increscens subsp. villosa]|uniref:Reverse transcriptase domain-containing protein n=1 Tax=Deinandra increscens subsp. villosa TaxID=3103831 RepID=A0AAP0GY14_9ASTR